MKIKSTFAKILHNRIFINLVWILTVVTVLGNLIYGNFHAVIFFILLAGLTSFFSKNLIVILLIPLIVVNIYTHMNKYKEGMDNKTKSGSKNTKSKPTKQNSNSSDKLSDKKKIDIMKNKNSQLPIVPLQDNSNESFETNTQSNQNKKKKYNIDYASTVEEAYDNLNSVLGGEGINNLTKDTQKLMKQQLQLTEAMKNMQPLMESMGPLLQQASGLLGSMGGSEKVNDLANLANKFSGK